MRYIDAAIAREIFGIKKSKDTPHYSTLLTDSWKIVSHLAKKGITMSIQNNGDICHVTVFYKDQILTTTSGSLHPAHIICLAALSENVIKSLRGN